MREPAKRRRDALTARGAGMAGAAASTRIALLTPPAWLARRLSPQRGDDNALPHRRCCVLPQHLQRYAWRVAKKRASHLSSPRERRRRYLSSRVTGLGGNGSGSLPLSHSRGRHACREGAAGLSLAPLSLSLPLATSPVLTPASSAGAGRRGSLGAWESGADCLEGRRHPRQRE